MKSIYKILLFFAALLCASVPAHGGEGSTCSDPIVLTPEYQETFVAACSKWYVANTFDLPLAIDFYPIDENALAPDLYLDFGCTPGEYDDPILCGLFCTSHSAYITMPYKQTPAISHDAQGKARYHVEFGQFYRDMLLRQGIDYNVPVYVRAVFYCGGTLTMEPDAFNSCMDGAKFMHLGDTVNVQAYDKDRHVIVPYVQWQFDSIRYVWKGDAPCTIAIGNRCDFDPTKGETTILDRGTIQSGEAFKVSSELLMQYVSDQTNYPNDAGMYFAKFYSESPGVMTVEKIPAPLPGGGATILKYGTNAKVNRNDPESLYAIPSSWVKSMQFTTPTDHVFKMYIGSTPDFTLETAEAVYPFDKVEDGHQLRLLERDMTTIQSYRLATEKYLYIRFECSDNTTVLPTLWTPSDCMEKAQRIIPGKKISVGVKSKVIYSLFYEEWKGGDMTFVWDATQATCPFYIAGSCDVPSSDNEPVFYSGKVPTKSVPLVCPQSTVDAWEDQVDPDGFLYIRFYSQSKGNITVSTSAPAEEDPPCESYDSVLTVKAWDSYTWRGTAYTEGGDYTAEGTIDPETGCPDTLFTLHLTVGTTTRTELTVTECDKWIIGEKEYTETGVYEDTTYTDDNHRTIETRDITIHHATTGEVTAKACEVYWSDLGNEYTESGDYTEKTVNKAGCDSIITLHLTIGHTTYGEWSHTVCYRYETPWGEMYTVSDTYEYTIPNADGCDSIVTLYLTVREDCAAYDTVYFCRGFNKEHEERVSDDLILRYLPYTYEAPTEWDYMEGVILEREAERTLVDLHRAEANLHTHYSDGLTPVEHVVWSARFTHSTTYTPIVVENEPQWIAAGKLAVQIRFRCGEIYNTAFPMDAEELMAEEQKSGTKILMNGQLIILRGGEKYNLLGTKIQ